MSDTTLFALGLNLAVPSEEEQDPATPMLQIVVQTGTLLPLDTGTGQPLPIPIDTYRIPVPRELAINLGESLVEAGNNLPEPVVKPDIAVVGNLDDNKVEQAARVSQAIRKGRPGG